jgi:hypothetical protein
VKDLLYGSALKISSDEFDTIEAIISEDSLTIKGDTSDYVQFNFTVVRKEKKQKYLRNSKEDLDDLFRKITAALKTSAYRKIANYIFEEILPHVR